jgi:hypothetical protein
MTRYLILDIEAVVDRSVWTPPEDDPEAFAPVFAWRPICVGLVLLRSTAAGLEVERTGAIEENGGGERQLLERFHATVVKLGNPVLVTWNGRAFDLPVLMLRSLRHGFRAPWYYGPHRTRYSDPVHCDLMDTMGEYGAVRSLGLDGMARLIGLPGKPRGADEVSGKNVAAAYQAGRIAEITRYCIADAVQTAFIWLRWMHLRGGVTLGWYRQAAGDLLTACDHDERLGALVASVDRRVLLLEESGEAAA